MDDLDRFVAYSPEPPAKAPRRRLEGSTLAIVSLACGLTSMPAMLVPGLGLLLGVVAVVSGCRALARIPGEARMWFHFGILTPLVLLAGLFTSPRGRALLGIAVGLVGAAFNVVVWCLILTR